MDKNTLEYKYEIKLFFSWQSDNKKAYNILRKALNDAKRHMEVMGIKLNIEQDTRDKTGAPDIARTIFEKIDNCQIFLADLTPISMVEGKEVKLIPNPNVMFESGYAFHALGEEMVLLMTYLEKEQTLSALPFDIKTRRITAFKDKKSLLRLSSWIIDAITQANANEQIRQEQRSCKVTFNDENCSISVKPKYRQIYYFNPQSSPHKHVRSKLINDVIFGPNLSQTLLKNYNSIICPFPQLVKPSIGKEHDRSRCPIDLSFYNMGSEAIENCNIKITLNNTNVSFVDTDVAKDHNLLIPLIFMNNDPTIKKDYISAHYNIINPNSSCHICKVFLCIPYGIETFVIHWHMDSKYFCKEGELFVNIEPEIQYDHIPDELKAGSDEIVPLIERDE